MEFLGSVTGVPFRPVTNLVRDTYLACLIFELSRCANAGHANVRFR
jgi:hypothetical protein